MNPEESFPQRWQKSGSLVGQWQAGPRPRITDYSTVLSGGTAWGPGAGTWNWACLGALRAGKLPTFPPLGIPTETTPLFPSPIPLFSQNFPRSVTQPDGNKLRHPMPLCRCRANHRRPRARSKR